VPAPPDVNMVSPPTIPRNASRKQSKGRAREGSTKRSQGHYKGRSPNAPVRVAPEPGRDGGGRPRSGKVA
jgi:hypothetical protein